MRRELRTYQVTQPIRMSWPNRPGGSGGNVDSTRCNIFSYNMAYQGGLALPTQHYARRNGPPLSDPLSPAQLAGPLRNPNAPDPRGVRNYFQQVDPSQARPGDWVLYHHPPNPNNPRANPNGSWGHVDVVSSTPTTRADGDIQLQTIGAGGRREQPSANRPNPDGRRDGEMYEGSVRFGAGETVHGSRAGFDRAMVIRPMRARPAGDTDPNASE